MGERLPPTFPMKLVTQRKLINQTRPLMSLCVPKLPNTWPMSIVFLTEVFRVLKPNCRTVFVATDWDALVWFSDDPKRMSAVMKSWEAHCAHPRLPRSMAFRLVNGGFRLDGAAVFPILNLQYTDDTYSKASYRTSLQLTMLQKLSR